MILEFVLKFQILSLWEVHRIPRPGQARSRRTSLSSNENGSLTRDAARDVTLSDFAFVEQLEDFRRQLLDLRKDKKKLEDEIIKYKLLCKEKHQSIQVRSFFLYDIPKLFIDFQSIYRFHGQLTEYPFPPL